ncbi:MAG TPA: hypothetical protein VD862_00980 [Candidatus Paceibacterota bacterium]|nr:hypothetical protein [Candidatus Paceibacterota bacterium]
MELTVTVVVSGIIIGTLTAALAKARSQNRQLRLAGPPRKSFRLDDLIALGGVITNGEKGAVLNAVLAQQDIENNIGLDYQRFTVAIDKVQEDIAAGIERGERQIEQIKARNEENRQLAAEKRAEAARIAALVTNVS